MSYSDAINDPHGWQPFTTNAPKYLLYGWGSYRLVTINGVNVLLFKSETHIDSGYTTEGGGAQYGEALGLLVQQFIASVRPALILSTGTAGGTRTSDAIGTVNIVNAATFLPPEPPSQPGPAESTWSTYSSTWTPNLTIVHAPAFAQQLMQVPTTQSDLEGLVAQFNAKEKTNFTLAQLDPSGLDSGQANPPVNDLTPKNVALLTATSFVVGTVDGKYSSFGCVEMDDSAIAQACTAAKPPVLYGSVRNISDAAQAVGLSPNDSTQVNYWKEWGGLVYDTYGVYTSYNGALAAWAIVTAWTATAR